MPDSFSLLPNLRTVAAADAQMGDDGRLATDYHVAIIGDGTEQGARIPISARFRGPGDVIGIAPSQILRCEPADGAQDVEPDYFAFVEFRDADFPWRYALSPAGSDRAEPWLALIALRPDEFLRLGQGSAPLPRIRVHDAAASLPPLDQRWATAHVQLTGPETGEAARNALRDDPARGLSRLMCLRRLDPLTRYALFLVPSCAAGLQAGLGQTVTATDAPAWDAARGGAIDLPFYFTATFRTADATNLEAALRRLRAIRPDAAAALAAAETFRMDHPGHYAGLSLPRAEAEIQTALAAQGDAPGANPTPPRLRAAMSGTLNAVIAGEAADSAEDPLVAFPPYGFRHADPQAPDEPVTIGAGRADWLGQVNLDLRHRLTAALGARIVRHNQEEFARLAWDQHADLAEANRRIARLETAAHLVARIGARHFDRLPADVAVVLAEPMAPYARSGPDRATTVAGVLHDQGAPAAHAARDLRRLAAAHPLHDPATRARAIPAPPLPGDLTPSPASAPRKGSAVRQAEEALRLRAADPAVDAALRQVFRASALGQAPRPRVPAVAVGAYRSTDLRHDLGASLRSLPARKAAFRVQGRTPAEAASGAPIYRAPRLPVPLADYMVRIAPEALISGAQDLPDNTITFFEERRSFVESLLAGANHALNDELRWRGFATDLRGTPLARFWNRGAPPADRTQDDIGPITGWTGPLGRQPDPANPDGTRRLVVVIKGDVVRKLDQPILRIDLCATPDWTDTPQTSRYPVFSGKLRADTAYYGFDVARAAILARDRIDRAFFVILEPRGRLRFGLDVGHRAARDRRAQGSPRGAVATWDDLGWQDMQLTASGHVRVNRTLPRPAQDNRDLWGPDRTSASLALSFWQKPVAAVLPLRLVIDD